MVTANSELDYFRQLKALILKELRQIMRDRQLIFLLFLAPVLQLFIYGYALSPEVDHLRLGVIDFSDSPQSRELIAALTSNQVFDLLPAGGSLQALGEKVRAGDLDAGVVIPPELARNIKAGRVSDIQILLDGVDANSAGIAAGYTAQIIAVFNQVFLAGVKNIQNAINPQISFAYNPGLISSWFFVPGVMAMVLNLVSTLVSSAAVIREKDSGTLEQLLMAPVDPLQILLAKILPLSGLLMGNVCLSLLLTVFVFRVPFRGNLLLFFSVSFLAIIVGISFGIALAAFAENQRQSLLTSFFINLPIIQLSGAIAPIESMPEFFRILSYLDPLRYYVGCVRAIVLKGAGMAEIGGDVVALALFASLLLFVSTARFRRQLQ